MTNIYADLPTVIEIISLEDAGEGGAAVCPHCGALGRYVYYFTASDGHQYGAMRGCFAHFPKSRFFDRLAEILKKEKDAAKKGRKLASWDIDVQNAIRDYGNNRKSAEQVDEIIRQADNAKRAYCKRMGYR